MTAVLEMPRIMHVTQTADCAWYVPSSFLDNEHNLLKRKFNLITLPALYSRSFIQQPWYNLSEQIK